MLDSKILQARKTNIGWYRQIKVIRYILAKERRYIYIREEKPENPLNLKKSHQ